MNPNPWIRKSDLDASTRALIDALTQVAEVSGDLSTAERRVAELEEEIVTLRAEVDKWKRLVAERIR